MVRAFQTFGPPLAVEGEDARWVVAVKSDVLEHGDRTVGREVVEVVDVWAHQIRQRLAAPRRVERRPATAAREHRVVGVRQVHRAYFRAGL